MSLSYNIKNKRYRQFFRRLVTPLFDPYNYTYVGPLILGPYRMMRRYARFFKDLIVYSRMSSLQRPLILDIYPLLSDRIASNPYDYHYFYQDIWAFRRILKSKVDYHVDVGSRADFVGFLSSITNVTFVDIRVLRARLEGLTFCKGDILSLPFKDNSIPSISCLHVAEHVGLGRYGDKLDPKGTENAIKELSRVLKPGGSLYFSVPIGEPRVYFNNYRMHSTEQILELCSPLELIEFSGVGDDMVFRQNIDIGLLNNENFGCGFFHFIKR